MECLGTSAVYLLCLDFVSPIDSTGIATQVLHNLRLLDIVQVFDNPE